ncbi:hypothetical protein Tco_0378773 [Tanacetum coccineum]
MVAYLQKTEGSEGFHQIVDFLNASHISYAFTENPTIYVSLINQFWQTATTRTLDNGEIEITATIDGKDKIVTEASVRRHLKLEDSDGISNLPTTEIFKQLALMGSKKIAWEQFRRNIATAIIFLATNRKFNFSKLIFDGMGPIFQGEGSTVPVESHHTPTSAPSTSPPPISPSSRRIIRQEYMVPQPRSPTQTHVADEAASTGVDVKHGGAATTVSGLEQDRAVKVESLEADLKQTKQVYGAAYTKLIMKVKKLKRATKSSQARRRVQILVSGDEDDVEDSSKQGRKIDEIDQDPDISLEVSTAEEVCIANVPVTTAGAEISTTSPEVKTAAESLMYIRRSATKDKGKAKIDESEPAQTKTKLQQRQERLGYEAAVRLQAELEEEERQRIVRVHEEASSFNIEEWENIQARVEADEEIATRLQIKEQGELTIKERSRLFVELMNKRKKYFAAKRAEERTNKPLIQAQQRTYMSNYIKHMGNYTLQQLRRYPFDEIKALFETTMRRVSTFLPMESDFDKAFPELATGSSKRAVEEELGQQSSKKQKPDELSQEELQ